MEEIYVERIKTFIKAEKLSVNALSKAIKMNQATINNYFIRSRKLSFEFIAALLTTYPTLSAEWLFRGTGEMYLSEDKGKPQEKTGNPQEKTGNPPEPQIYTGDTSDKDELFESLKARIAEQENYIADLRFVARLDKKQ